MILVIVALWLGYKKAKASNRNPWLWAFICGSVFIGAQVLVGVILGFTDALLNGLDSRGEGGFFTSFGVMTVASLISGFAALWLVFRFLDRPVEQPVAIQAPPPPPTFGNDL